MQNKLIQMLKRRRGHKGRGSSSSSQSKETKSDKDTNLNPRNDSITSSQNPSASHYHNLLAVLPGPIPPNATRAMPPASGTFELARCQNTILGNLLEQVNQVQDNGRIEDRRRERSPSLPPQDDYRNDR